MPTRGRKKRTKDWCKGKEGVAHTPVIQYRHDWLYQVTHENLQCQMRPTYGRRRPPNFEVNITGEHWSCFHAEVCASCEKILRWSLHKEECPVYKEKNE